MTDFLSSTSPLPSFRGRVLCRRFGNAVSLSGSAADSAEEVVILTFIAPRVYDLPESLTTAAVFALGEGRYRIASASGEWLLEATSLHIHRDIGPAFYRAVPPRPAPLKKRLFWWMVMALARNRAGKRLLLALRGR